MKKKNLMVGAPQVLQPEVEEIVRVIKSGWWVAGPQVKKFASEFKEEIGSKFAVPVSSGTAALHLSLGCLNIGSGDEVITTPFTFPATAHAIVYVGAKPVFVDIEKGTFNIDPEKISQAINKKTKAILPVHIAGHPCEMDPILEIAKNHSLFVVSDAAHAVEAWYRGRRVGTISDLTCFSFDVTKNVAGGVGGMVTTDNEEWAETISVRSNFGIRNPDFSEPDDTIYPGYKYHMTEFCAAIARHQLRRVRQNLRIREKYWQMYNEAFGSIPELIVLSERGCIIHGRHLYMVLLDLERLSCSRKEFMQALASKGVIARIRFSPVHLHTYYRETYGFESGDFPVAENVSERVVCLPLSPALTKNDIRYVISAVKSVVNRFKI